MDATVPTRLANAPLWHGASRVIVLIITAVTIAGGCAGNDDGANNSAAKRMLAVANPSSPIIDALQPSFAADVYTGVEDVARYQLVTYDGNTISGDELASDTLVDQALDAGTSVLVVNARPEHKQALATLGRAAAAVGANSHAYLLTPFTQPGGRSAVHITHIRDEEYDLHTTTVHDTNNGFLTGNLQTVRVHHELAQPLVDAFVDLVNRRVAGDAGDPRAPDGLPQDICWFTQVVTEVFIQNGKDLPNNSGSRGSCTPGCNNDDACPSPTPGVQVQQPTQTLNYTFRVFLDNGDPNESKWFQWVNVEVSGTMSPGPLIEFCRDCTRDDPNYFGFGWLQSKIDIHVAPVNSDAGGGTNLAPYSSSPEAPSGGAYNSASEFDVTYTTKGGTAQQLYTWSSITPPEPDVLPLADWTVSQPAGASNEFVWQWKQTAPFDNDLDNYTDAFSYIRGGILDYRINVPIPALSTGEFPLTAQGVWKTLSVVNHPIAIDHQAARTFVLLQADFQGEGHYDRDSWTSTVDPGPMEAVINFRQATAGYCADNATGFRGVK